jgi:glycosyltransferase involved in cell wall biosynthesis
MTTPSAGVREHPLANVTVIIPVRNAEAFIDDCLRSVVASGPAAVIVVDGLSTDRTLAIAERYDTRILSDGGRGVAAARIIGARAATTEWVALVDVDVLLPPGALAALLDETREGDYTALQAGLESISGPGYWGQALVTHHRSGRSKGWFGLVATIFRREALLALGLDPTFVTGEDIEVRWRLQQSGARIGVSKQTIVSHRFGDSFEFARGQFLADGAGLARMATKHGWRAAPLLGLPLAAAVRGVLVSALRRQPRWIPYYATFLALNWFAMGRQLIRQIGLRQP